MKEAEGTDLSTGSLMRENAPPRAIIVLYHTEDGSTCSERRFENETIWLT